MRDQVTCCALVKPETGQEQTSLAPVSAGEYIGLPYVETRCGTISTDTFPIICGSAVFSFLLLFFLFLLCDYQSTFHCRNMILV